jgi:hypothetical protein
VLLHCCKSSHEAVGACCLLLLAGPQHSAAAAATKLLLMLLHAATQHMPCHATCHCTRTRTPARRSQLQCTAHIRRSLACCLCCRQRRGQ